ncbi:hypothetical protein F5Y15DRAFT_265809 [Xylariaceae sp. FL0016]|nr:hypothetical protein F5Y15DRAFT_265809 [Xylariaceae sp. FL0016]
MGFDADTQQGVLLTWVFGTLAISLMTLRLIMRTIRERSWNLSDYLTAFAIVLMLARSLLTHYVLTLGDNQHLAEKLGPDYAETITTAEMNRRMLGAKLSLPNRAVYNTYIWTQKGVVLLLTERLLAGLPRTVYVIRCYWVVLLVTLLAVQITSLSECHPFHLYWQIIPDPGTCSETSMLLYVLTATNITTDLMLIALPMPYLFRVKRSLFQKIQLIALFSIGFTLVVIAILRLPIYGDGEPADRNAVGSVEGFLASVVANVPTLVTLRRKKLEPVYDLEGIQTIGSKSTSDNRKDSFHRISSSDEGITVTREYDVVHLNNMEPGDEHIPQKSG